MYYAKLRIALVVLTLVVACLVGSAKTTFAARSRSGYPSVATATANGVTVTVTWLHIDNNRAAIEYTVSGLKQVPGYEASGCPIQAAQLTNASGQKIGKGEPQTRCIMDENLDFHVTQSFYDNLASVDTKPQSLHFATTVVNSGKVTSTDANGNYTTAPGSPLGEFNFDLTASLEKDLTIQQSLARSSNGINGLLRSVEFNPSFIASEICITLPSTADWQPEAVLVSDQGRVAADSWAILNFKQSKAWASRNRCYRFTFPAALDLNQTSNFQIEIERLATSLPEGVTETQCNAARDRLAAGSSGITIACHQTASGYNFEVTQKPAGMSVEDAYRTSAHAFSDVVEGPWTFTVAAYPKDTKSLSTQEQSQVWCYEVVQHSDGTLSITGHQPPVIENFLIAASDKLKARCFASWADAVNFLSGGKVKLPNNATEKDYLTATETLVVDNDYVTSALWGAQK